MKRRRFIKTAVAGVGSISLAGFMKNSSSDSPLEERKSEYRDYTDVELINAVVKNYSESLDRLRRITGTKSSFLQLMRGREYDILNERFSRLETQAAEASSRYKKIEAQVSLLEERSEESFDTINTVVNSLRTSVQSARGYLSDTRDAASYVPSDNKEMFDEARVRASRDYAVFTEELRILPPPEQFISLLETVVLD